MKKVLVILGHPRPGSFCECLATAYAQACRNAGAEVQQLSLGQLTFDPVLREGYLRDQPLEPELAAAQASILWADHLVFVYPNWWGTAPALLKGFIDRVFLPGFAFRYREGSHLWDRLLTGRTGRALVTMDSPGWYYRWFAGAPGDRHLRRSVLEFCGVKPVRIAHFGPMRTSTQAERSAWLKEASALAARDSAWRPRQPRVHTRS